MLFLRIYLWCGWWYPSVMFSFFPWFFSSIILLTWLINMSLLYHHVFDIVMSKELLLELYLNLRESMICIKGPRAWIEPLKVGAKSHAICNHQIQLNGFPSWFNVNTLYSQPVNIPRITLFESDSIQLKCSREPWRTYNKWYTKDNAQSYAKIGNRCTDFVGTQHKMFRTGTSFTYCLLTLSWSKNQFKQVCLISHLPLSSLLVCSIYSLESALLPTIWVNCFSFLSLLLPYFL